MYGVPNAAIKLALSPANAAALAGKRVTVIGGTAGIGRALARAAVAHGATVNVVGRTFRDAGVTNMSFTGVADLGSLAAARELGRALPPADLVLLTTGTGPAPKRELTAEGIEKDMAVSCLSRLVVLRELVPRLPAGARVGVWGMPGNGIPGANVDDLNAERGKYEGNFGWVHQNTVAGNEALVVHLAAQHTPSAVSFFGFNPGLIPTGLRSFIYGAGVLASAAEGLIGLFNPSPEAYAETVLQVLTAPDLEAHSGAMFGSKGGAVLADAPFRGEAGAANAAKWYGAMEALARDKAGV